MQIILNINRVPGYEADDSSAAECMLMLDAFSFEKVNPWDEFTYVWLDFEGTLVRWDYRAGEIMFPDEEIYEVFLAKHRVRMLLNAQTLADIENWRKQKRDYYASL